MTALADSGILLGFEMGTGKEVYLKLAHTVVTGMTQLSGKTTCLQAIIDRSGLRAIAFKTKRGEAGFNNYHEILPYFVEQSDWKYVSGVLEAYLHEKVKFERSWIMKATKNTRSLKDVLHNIQALKVKAHGLSESVYSVLEQYLIEIIPQIDRFKFSKTLNVSDGINVMDLSEMTLEMRLLVIRSVMEKVITDLHSIIVIIPEAWEAIPQGRNTPVKLYAEIFIRKGASIGNYLFIDSQDIAGIDKTPLRQCNNWIMGRQRETHEVERVREVIGKKIGEEEIKTLKVGHFIAALGDDLKRVYVLPTGVPEQLGREVALGLKSPDDVREWMDSHKEVDDLTNEERVELERLREDKARLEGELAKHKSLPEQGAEVKHWKDIAEKAKQEVTDRDKVIASQNLALEGYHKRVEKFVLLEKLGDTLRELIGPISTASTLSPVNGVSTDLKVDHPIGSIEVTHIRRVVVVDTSTMLGKLALLFSEGSFTVGRKYTMSDMGRLFAERGWGWANSTGKEALIQLTDNGFFSMGLVGNRPDWTPKMAPEEAMAKGLLKVTEVIA